MRKTNWDEYTRQELVDKIELFQDTVNDLIKKIGVFELSGTGNYARLQAEVAGVLVKLAARGIK